VNPRWPVFIPSRGRAGKAPTMRTLDRMRVPYRIIAEDQEHDAYARCYGEDRVLALPRKYIDGYYTGDPEGDELALPYGPGLPRNYALDIARAEGAAWHWTMDDNIQGFYRYTDNRTWMAGDGWVLAAMEDHASRYSNVGLAGPEYYMFVSARDKYSYPFRVNRRVMSCQLIRTGAAAAIGGWRLRYNDDIDFCIRLLEAGWCTLVYVAFLQHKMQTQGLGGGSADTIYAGGTGRKTDVLIRHHPQVAKAVTRWGRPHHVVDWDRWQGMHPVRDPAWQPRPDAAAYQHTRIAPRTPQRRARQK
jgi:hypothetical protein